MVGILFVCMGNICRSPLAEGVFRAHAIDAGMANRLQIDSCGTISYHSGDAPDRRAQAIARQNGVDISTLRARQIGAKDYQQYDLLLAMDRQNLAQMEASAPETFNGTVRLFLDFASGLQTAEVPDPYYGGEDGFSHCFHLVDAASRGLVKHLQHHHGLK